MSEGELRSALVVAVPEAASVVDGWRERTCQAKPSTGVPAHVTILWPFVPAARIDDALVAHLHSLFEATESFTFALRTAARFPETLYLVPEPADRFAHLTRLVFEAYPEYPPYEGAFDAIVPHLTVAEGNGQVLAEAEAEVVPQLPIVARAREALLLEEIQPDATLWRPRATFPFCD